MSNWLANKGAGPWAFTEQPEKPCYNEGDRIRCRPSQDSPVWSMDDNGDTPITPEHDPCGYWYKGLTPSIPVVTGLLYGMGANDQTAMGNPILGPYISGTVMALLSPKNDWLAIAAGYGGSIGLRGNRELWGTGGNSFGDLGNVGQVFTWTRLAPSTGWIQAAMGTFFSWALAEDGTLWSTGHDGQVGILGQGPGITILAEFTKVGLATNWASVACGSTHSLALDNTGNLYGCGQSNNGQLGDLAGPYQTTLTQFGSAVAKMCGAFNNTHIIKIDGTLWGTGFDYYGTLGAGSTGIRYGFIQEAHGYTNWRDVSSGAYHAGAIRNDGTLWTTGLNDHGQLGLGDTTNRSVFTQVGSDTDWVAVKFGAFHSVALKSDGTMWTWGMNAQGAAGYTSGSDVLVPTQPAPGSTWISVGDYRSYMGFSLPNYYTRSMMLRAQSPS